MKHTSEKTPKKQPSKTLGFYFFSTIVYNKYIMQIFEFHFNPKLKEDQNFDSFVYEPESSYEKKLGSLYIVGELQNTLSQNSKLLDNIAQIFKKNYYSLSIKSAEKALSSASKKANEFLSEEVKKENMAWLGNLNFATISLNDFNLTFTKTGDLKVLLLRGSQTIDIGKDLEIEDIDPYPLKIFLNVITGKLEKNDKLLILTKDVFGFLEQENILSKLAKTEKLDHKIIKKILPHSLFNKRDGTKVSGICFIAVLTPEKNNKEKAPILFENNTKKSILSIFSSIVNKIPRPRKIKLSKLSIRKKEKKAGIPKLKVPVKTSKPIIERFKNQTNIKKRVLPIVGFILILAIGFYIFKGIPKKEEKEIKVSLEEIQRIVDEANNLLIFNNEKDANPLLQQALEGITELIDKDTPLKTDILSLKESIETSLNKINKLEMVELEIATEFTDESDMDKKKELAKLANTNIAFSNSTIYILKNNKWREKNFESSSNIFSSYFSNLYFLDNCDVFKYSHLGGTNWGNGKKWLNDKTDCSNPKSIAVDGSVYILNSDNSISIYHSGLHEKTIRLNIFPEVKSITEIRTKVNVPYIYLLEPTNNRVIVIDKEGNIVRQFQNENFNNLKDIDISPTGKTIYLLSNSVIYIIKL